MAARSRPPAAPPPAPDRAPTAPFGRHLVAAAILAGSLGGAWWVLRDQSGSTATPGTTSPLTPDPATGASIVSLPAFDTSPSSAGSQAPVRQPSATEQPLETGPLATAPLAEAAATPDVTAPEVTVSDVTVPGSVPAASFELTRLPAPTVDLVGGEPAVDAASYVVYDVATNRVIAAKAADVARPVGSVIKLLSTLVVLQAGPLDDPVTVPTMQVDIKESQIGLRAGEQLTRGVLLRAMLIVSANDAARALAIDVAGSEAAFAKRMNATAKALRLTDTKAANPIGLDAPGAHSTADDVLVLARQVLRSADVRAAVSRRSAKLHGVTYPATNKLLGAVAGADGIKTGHTTGAGYCVAASATRNGRQIIVVVLGSSSDASRTKAGAALFRWAFAH